MIEFQQVSQFANDQFHFTFFFNNRKCLCEGCVLIIDLLVSARKALSIDA